MDDGVGANALLDLNSDIEIIADPDNEISDELLINIASQPSSLTNRDEDGTENTCTKYRTVSNTFQSSPPYVSGRLNPFDYNGENRSRTDRQISLHSSPTNENFEELLISPYQDEEDYVENGSYTNTGTDHCHTTTPSKTKSRKAITKLIIACGLTSVFMIGECIGGWLANSIAIMSDAAHMMSDLTSFIVSLIAIYLALRPASKKMSYGYQRAEVLGAVISVLMIWLVTGVLVYIAIERTISMEFEVDADTMIIVAALGVVFNIVLGFVLHTGSGSHGHSHGGVSHGSDDSSGASNINIRAAFIHVLGDLIQSVGVLIAAYIIRYYPAYKIADPICTFLFSIIVIATTIPILKDLSLVLMEGTPSGIDYSTICEHLRAIKGVKMVHSLHVWALTLDKNALSVHLAIHFEGCDSDMILKEAQRVVRYRHQINHTTIQVEKYIPSLMDNCQQCQPLAS